MDDKSSILIIEDEVDLSDMLKFQLESKGYQVDVANNGIEGLEKLEKIKPNLILLDLNMPKMGGIEFYNQITDNEGNPKYPVLVLTARANMEQMFKDFNVDGFISKPFELDVLMEEIEVIIGNHTALEQKKRRSAEGSSSVMIIEDDEAKANGFKLVFSKVGYKVSIVKNGAEAIEKIKEEKAEIVLINMMLPGMSGDQVVLKLSRMPMLMRIDYIVYIKQGGLVSHSVLENYRKKSGNQIYVDTDDPRSLLETVKGILSRRKEDEKD